MYGQILWNFYHAFFGSLAQDHTVKHAKTKIIIRLILSPAQIAHFPQNNLFLPITSTYEVGIKNK